MCQQNTQTQLRVPNERCGNRILWQAKSKRPDSESDMSEGCPNCGCKMSSGICSNCNEELYILTFQTDDLPEEISPEFMQKAEEQRKKLQIRKSKYDVDIGHHKKPGNKR
jgi:hypothetical protein